jgi:hypothetical protein
VPGAALVMAIASCIQTPGVNIGYISNVLQLTNFGEGGRLYIFRSYTIFSQ